MLKIAVPRQTSFVTNHPLRFRFEVTSNCSFKCQHCYLGQETLNLPDLPLADVKEIIDKITAGPPVKILFQGGEPFERSDLFEILAYARSKGAAVSLDTNAWHLNDQKMIKLKEIGVDSINITIYGFTAGVNDSFTRAGHFQHIQHILTVAKKTNLRIHLALLVTRRNFCQFFAISRFAREYGIKKIHVDVFLAAQNFPHREKYQLNTPQFIVFWAMIRPFLRLSSLRPHLMRETSLRPSAEVSICDANRFPLIKPNGDLWPCLFYAASIGNILHEAPDDLWSKLAHFNFEERLCCLCLEKKMDRIGQKIMSANKKAARLILRIYRFYVRIMRSI